MRTGWASVVFCLTAAAFAQHPADSGTEKEELPTLEELLEKAQARSKDPERRPLQFTADFEVFTQGIRSKRGSFVCRGPRDFHFTMDLPRSVWTFRFLYVSQPERVLGRVQQLDIKDGDEGLVSESFQILKWKDAALGSRAKLLGLLRFFVADPPRLLEMARGRYGDLKVVGADELDGVATWVLEAVLHPHEIPQIDRADKPTRVRLVVEQEELLLRSHEALDAKGREYRSFRLKRVRRGKPPVDARVAIVPPRGAKLIDLVPRDR